MLIERREQKYLYTFLREEARIVWWFRSWTYQLCIWGGGGQGKQEPLGAKPEIGAATLH